jgi:hypothetical protein
MAEKMKFPGYCVHKVCMPAEYQYPTFAFVMLNIVLYQILRSSFVMYGCKGVNKSIQQRAYGRNLE